MRMPAQGARPFGFAAVFFSLWIAVLLAGATIRPAKTDFYANLAFGDAERLICWLVFPILWLMLVERRWIVTALRPVTPRSARMAMLAAVLLSMVLLLGMRMTRGQWHAVPHGYSMLQYSVAIVSIGLLALGEEFVFRGILLSGLTRRGWPFWIANLLVAIAFAFSHWPGWLLFGGIPATALVTASLRVLLFGFLMGALVRLEGGLATAILVHWLNDVLAGTLF